MSPRSVLITGGNRGIGIGLVRECLKDNGIEIVIATARKPEEAKELQAINDKRLHIVAMDQDCDKSIKQAYQEIEKIVGDSGLNVLINNAGIFVRYHFDKEINREDLSKQITTNSISVVMVTQVFLPLLKKAAAKSSGDDFSWDRAAIFNISSGAGSVGDNRSGSGDHGSLGYRMSKSALNSFGKCISVDLAPDHILVAQFCPGWVKTDMGSQRAEITIEESAEAMVKTFRSLNKGHNGGYFRRNGEAFPW